MSTMSTTTTMSTSSLTNTFTFLNTPIYINTMSLIQHICLTNNIDESHGLPHAIEIAIHVNNCISTQKQLSPTDQEDIILAALLHDVDDHKYFKTQNFLNANNILYQVLSNDEQQRINKILRMISLVSFSKNGNTINPTNPIWYYFPRYADRIQAIGLIGLLRTQQYSSRVNNPFYNKETIRPQSRQQLYRLIENRDKIYMQRGGKSQSVIDHVFDKLLHIKLPQEVRNEYLEKIYLQGHQYMVEFVIEQGKSGYERAQAELMQRVRKMEMERQLVNRELKEFLKNVGIEM